MASKKKPENLVHRSIITNDPQKAVSEYLRSKFQDRRLKKYPGWDVARAGPVAELIKCHREWRLAETELEAKMLERETRRKAMIEQWAELAHKEDLLRQSFIIFNKFVKENKEKRERGRHKILEEKERRVKCQEQIEQSTRELEYMTVVRDNMEKHLKEYKMYQNYLDSVVREMNTDEFQNLGDIFNRYESLVESRNVLARHQDQNLKALEVAGTEMQHMTEAKGQMLVDLNSKLAILQSRYERAKAHALGWETIVSRIKGTAVSKNLELTRVKACCWNMYQQLCKRKGFPIEIERDDVENQLAHIKRTIVELKRISKAAQKKTARLERAAGAMAAAAAMAATTSIDASSETRLSRA